MNSRQHVTHRQKNLSCVENCKILALKRGQHVYPLKTTFNFAYPITDY